MIALLWRSGRAARGAHGIVSKHTMPWSPPRRRREETKRRRAGYASPTPLKKRLRAHELGIPLEGLRGPHGAITDVPGLTVGYSTLIRGEGPLRVGEGPVRTGVTAIFPRGNESADPVFAGWFALNGNGEMTGTTWIEESGFLEGPVMLTNTHSVGVVRDAVVGWQAETGKLFQQFSNPLVAETYDGRLNDINGFHVKAEHVRAAIDAARPGPVAEGNVGGGTGMVAFQWKGGTGTSSRRTSDRGDAYTVGALVQANFGLRHQLLVAGVPVGRALPVASPAAKATEQGSIIVVLATDAPLLPHQCKRVARRAALGLARTGGAAGNGSGDIMVAFSTANDGAANPGSGVSTLRMLSNADMTAVFDAAIFATEEAILNAMFAADTMTGIDGCTVEAIPLDEVVAILRRHGRIA